MSDKTNPDPTPSRCANLTRYPRGWLRCVLPAGHDVDPLSLHQIDWGDPGVVPDGLSGVTEAKRACAQCGRPKGFVHGHDLTQHGWATNEEGHP